MNWPASNPKTRIPEKNFFPFKNLMRAWYNEIDPYAAEWLRRLIRAGEIAPGVVDERDIRNISPDDLKPYTQLHFFAGIGGWSLALRQSGWPDDRPVWTGSCPCQPFSSSGKGKAFEDDRHLWPAWFALIKARQPETIFGEQVASKPALEWLDLVSADLEKEGYAIGAADLCAAGLGAPHIRQRLWFGASRRLANSDGTDGPERMPELRPDGKTHGSQTANRSAGSSHNGGLANADGTRSQRWQGMPCPDQRIAGPNGVAEHTGQWSDISWLWCRDARWRPSQSGLCPLADGIPGRVGRLRAYGNAIVPQVAATFIKAFDGCDVT